MSKKVFLVCCFVVAAFISHAQKVTVAAAANVQFVLNEIKSSFEKETGIQVEIILNSSGKLTAQIKEFAPYDLFVSADMKYPQDLFTAGYATDAPKIYAEGLLVLWTARNDIKASTEMQMLTNTNIKKIALANPQTAPYGVAAEDALKYYNIYDAVKPKLVYGESISQTNQYILSQAADIGFTAKSIVLADEMKGKGTWVDVDRKAYKPIQQGVVMLKHGVDTNKAATEKFYNYLFSKKAKAIFKKYGYLVP